VDEARKVVPSRRTRDDKCAFTELCSRPLNHQVATSRRPSATFNTGLLAEFRQIYRRHNQCMPSSLVRHQYTASDTNSLQLQTGSSTENSVTSPSDFWSADVLEMLAWDSARVLSGRWTLYGRRQHRQSHDGDRNCGEHDTYFACRLRRRRVICYYACRGSYCESPGLIVCTVGRGSHRNNSLSVVLWSFGQITCNHHHHYRQV